MVQALLLLPRLVVTPPARLVVVPPHCAAVRRFTAPGVQLGEEGGRPARDAEQLLAAMSNAQARGGSVQMCSATRDSDREEWLATVQQSAFRSSQYERKNLNEATKSPETSSLLFQAKCGAPKHHIGEVWAGLHACVTDVP